MRESDNMRVRQNLDDAARIAENRVEPLGERIQKIRGCLERVSQEIDHASSLQEGIVDINYALDQCMCDPENN